MSQRRTPTRTPLAPPLAVAAALVLVIGLGGCGSVNKARDTADRAKDCAALAGKLSGLNLNAKSTEADVRRAITELERAIDGLSNAEVRSAAKALDRDVRSLEQKVKGTNQADIDRAVRRVQADAEALARTCNVPVDQLLGR